MVQSGNEDQNPPETSCRQEGPSSHLLTMNKRAVVIAGDYRTFESAVDSMRPLFHGADVFVSVWATSSFYHKINPKNVYGQSTITEDDVLRALDPIRPVRMTVEEYDPVFWRGQGYNANFLHRLRTGVTLVRKEALSRREKYDSVLFLRPDVFFGQNIDRLLDPVMNLEVGDFVTVFSLPERVRKFKTLNDILFAVHYDDLDRAVPTVQGFQPHKSEDWHTFYCRYVIEENGLTVKNVEEVQLVILRPPAVPGMKWEQAVNNSHTWDDPYVIRAVNVDGVKKACRDWGKHAVIRAIQNLDETSE